MTITLARPTPTLRRIKDNISGGGGGGGGGGGWGVNKNIVDTKYVSGGNSK